MRRLVIRPGAIGDCLLSLPALEFLRTEYTELWVPTAIVPLIDFGDAVRSIACSGVETLGVGDLNLDVRLADHLKSFDEIVSWYGANREEFRSAISSLGVPCRFHKALPPEGSTTHATDFFSAQVGRVPGATPAVRTNRIPAMRNTVVIHPFSGSASKNWPLHSYRQLAQRLDFGVEWLAGPEETLPDARHVEDLRELAEWLAGARLFIGNDSGITHLAAAIGIPTIALFGPTSPVVWAPRGNGVMIMQQHETTVDSLTSLIRMVVSPSLLSSENAN